MQHATVRSALAALGCAALLGSASAGTLSDVFSAVVDTTPAGLARSSAERDGSWGGFWEDTKRGSEYIMEEGRTLLVLPTYTNHPRWDWDNKDQENGYPFGMGLARQVIDEHGNERMFFLVNFVDSNYRIEPMVGYSWVARYPIFNTGWHYGAGYLAGITVRGDYYYLPAPLPLPVAKIGNDWFSFYGTFIPFTNVFFFYSSFTFDDVQSRKMPLPATSPWAKNTDFVYGGYGFTRTDNGEEHSPSRVDSDTSWHVAGATTRAAAGRRTSPTASRPTRSRVRRVRANTISTSKCSRCRFSTTSTPSTASASMRAAASAIRAPRIPAATMTTASTRFSRWAPPTP